MCLSVRAAEGIRFVKRSETRGKASVGLSVPITHDREVMRLTGCGVGDDDRAFTIERTLLLWFFNG